MERNSKQSDKKDKTNLDFDKLMNLIELNNIPYSMENQAIVISLSDIHTEEKPRDNSEGDIIGAAELVGNVAYETSETQETHGTHGTQETQETLDMLDTSTTDENDILDDLEDDDTVENEISESTIDPNTIVTEGDLDLESDSDSDSELIDNETDETDEDDRDNETKNRVRETSSASTASASTASETINTVAPQKQFHTNQNLNKVPNQNLNKVPNQNLNKVPNQNLDKVPNQNPNKVPNRELPKSKMPQHENIDSNPPSDKILLNVGGKVFKIKKQLLSQLNIYYVRLPKISKPKTTNGGNDENNENIYFLDRDPYYFTKVINILRDLRTRDSKLEDLRTRD